MLAQNFRGAADLGISDAEFESLVRALGAFERGEIPAKLFNMGHPGDQDMWNENDCGSPACILGWARFLARRRLFHNVAEYQLGIRALFMMGLGAEEIDWCASPSPFIANTQQAARAIRNFLTVGHPHWAAAMSTKCISTEK